MAIKVPIYDGQGQQTDSAKIFGSSNKANYALATAQNKWNLEQWERQNEYNSPKNQIALLKEAGLNPNLYANQGATAEGLVSADMANQQDMSGQYLNAMNMGMQSFNASLDRELAKKQLSLEKQKIDLESTRVQNESKQTDSQVNINEQLGKLYNSNVDMNEQQKENLKTQVEKMRHEMNDIDADIELKRNQAQLTAKDIEYYQSDKYYDYALKKAKTLESYKRAELYGEEIGMTKEQSKVLAVTAFKIRNEMSLQGQQFDMNKFQLRLMEADADYKEALLKFEQEHMKYDYYESKVLKYGDFILDIGSTVATFGFSKIGRSTPNRDPNRMPSNQSYSNPNLYNSDFMSRSHGN